jgi:hypothetical protein
MTKTIILAGALAFALSGAAFAQGSTVGGPSAAGAPQPPTSQPDSAKLNGTPQGTPMKNKKNMGQQQMPMQQPAAK